MSTKNPISIKNKFINLNIISLQIIFINNNKINSIIIILYQINKNHNNQSKNISMINQIEYAKKLIIYPNKNNINSALNINQSPNKIITFKPILIITTKLIGIIKTILNNIHPLKAHLNFVILISYINQINKFLEHLRLIYLHISNNHKE